MIILNLKKLLFNHVFIKFFSLLVILITLKLPLNSWEKYAVISLFTLGYFFAKINNEKKHIYFFAIFLLLFNTLKFFLPSNEIIERTAIYTSNSEILEIDGLNITKDIEEISNNILIAKNDYFLNIDYPRKWSFYADSFWSPSAYSRKLSDLNFVNRYELNIGELNDIGYYLPEAKNSYDLYYPLIISFKFKKLIADSICLQGLLFVQNDINNFDQINNKSKSCKKLENFDIENKVIIGLDLEKSSNISIELIHSGIINKILSNIHILDFLLSILFLLKLFKYNIASFFTLLLSNSFYIIYLYDLILKGLPSRFSELVYLQRGNDGLTHFRMGRDILENIHNNNFFEALKGGSDIFYFMPGMRYANAILMSIFGDTVLGYLLITSFIPLIIYKILRKLINKNWSIILLWCFMIIPIFESFGFFQFYYSKLTVLGFGGSLGYFCLFLGTLILLPDKNISFYSKSRTSFFMIGLLFFCVIIFRPNYILQFILLYLLLGFHLTYLFFYERKNLTLSKVQKYFLLIFGFSPILLILLHNWFFGKEFILLTSASIINENLRVSPNLLIGSLKELAGLQFNKENWEIIINNLRTWINYYEFWLIIIYVNLWIGVFRKNNYFIFRIISFSLIISHSTYIFYAGDHRYTYGLWCLSLILFFKDFKEFYFKKFFRKKLKKFIFEKDFKPLFYKILDPSNSKFNI